MTMLGSFGFCGSLLVPATLNDASPDKASAAEMVAAVMNFLSGGQSVQFASGKPESAGGVLSILIPLAVAEAELLARSKQVPLTC